MNCVVRFRHVTKQHNMEEDGGYVPDGLLLDRGHRRKLSKYGSILMQLAINGDNSTCKHLETKPVVFGRVQSAGL